MKQILTTPEYKEVSEALKKFVEAMREDGHPFDDIAESISASVSDASDDEIDLT